ncbi:radical SAM (seleno)protein TrsS [Lacrimispora amygdalina]|jgi:hypothetical protein|uniref:radical SAM (seleno)protein TrsS n=2 Tax=Lacrimispora TaxID=2719231 RepID=UPI003B5106E1
MGTGREKMVSDQYETESLCPVCLKKIPAFILTENDVAYMYKICPDHGRSTSVLWRSKIPISSWIRNKERAFIKNPVTSVKQGCPFDCGLCEEHRQHTCTALLEVTQNCNLNCRFCFADSHPAKEKEPSLEDLRKQYQTVFKVSGSCNIQLSGGEPTVRDDLPDIVRMGTELGFSFIQLNTNGIRIADEEDYVRRLKQSGLSSVFLQFDGISDEIYKKLRGRPLFEKKVKAIENCRKFGIGVVLVPTLVPGVNTGQIGEIIRFAIDQAPAVRGVHFQPVSYFGRMPHAPSDEDRITLPEVMEEVTKQTGGMVSAQSMKPPGCENSLCSFHGNYIIEGNVLNPVTKRESCCCGTTQAEEGAKKAKAFVARNWTGHDCETGEQQKVSSDWDMILQKIQRNSFSISAMAFQDAWNVNLERIKDCCIHVVTGDLRLIPFCMYHLTNTEGRSLYRNLEKGSLYEADAVRTMDP